MSLLTGSVGRKGAGFATITGQGNGQGGREHGQKADQLPGYRKKYFKYNSPEDIFNELRVASKGGIADYSGISYDKIEKMNGVCWPCPSDEHEGTPRMLEDLRFNFPNGKARIHAFDHTEPNEKVSEDYPLILTTGRVVFHYLSGNQTRRIESLRKLCPDPYCEIHPNLAAKLGIGNGQNVKISSRRGSIVVPAKITKIIREDSLFVPYHWGKTLAINHLTNPALDPKSKIPEFKVCAVQYSLSSQDRRICLMAKVLYIDFERCIGCHACMIGCEECSGHDHLSRMFVDELNPGETVATSPTPCMHFKSHFYL
jgi:predicted molibdopterin-dependent oxidoreductase YjgC